MDKATQDMTPTELLEEFRTLTRSLGAGNFANKKITQRADLLEQEILRRMAW